MYPAAGGVQWFIHQHDHSHPATAGERCRSGIYPSKRGQTVHLKPSVLQFYDLGKVAARYGIIPQIAEVKRAANLEIIGIEGFDAHYVLEGRVQKKSFTNGITVGDKTVK